MSHNIIGYSWPSAIRWYPQTIYYSTPGKTIHFDWAEPWPNDWVSFFGEKTYQEWEARQLTWQYRLRRTLSAWWNTVDAIWPCEISQWVSRQLRRYADWLDERSWYL